MIFLSGIHGVGKSYFCNMVKEQLGIESYSASKLITDKRNRGFSPNKFVPDIDENQLILLAALNDLNSAGKEFILDGHFCLLNEHGEITRIPQDTYTSLKPTRIILLTEKPEIIAQRRLDRDGTAQDIEPITAFQNEEHQYAKEISSLLDAPLIVSKGAADLNRILEFIREGGI
mgnify:CR=1 FL=1|jgi:Archaeal adenylate kinase